MGEEKNRLGAILEKLWAAEGRPERDEEDDVLGVVVRMMLAQATSKANASQAFGDLVDAFGGEWSAVANARTTEVAGAIEVGGLSRQKAPRIQALLRRVREDFGDYSLEALRDWEPDQALAYLKSFDGVGPTTATFALMDAAGMDLFPINGGIRRLLSRVGILDESMNDAKAHAAVRAMLRRGDGYAAHVTLVVHARTVCKAQGPKCGECAAGSLCVFGTTRRGGSG